MLFTYISILTICVFVTYLYLSLIMAQQVTIVMDHTDAEGAPTKQSRTEQDSDSDVEEIVPRYDPINVPDVFESNEVRPPEGLKNY